MPFLPNAKLTIMRGVYTDDVGDTHDSAQPIAVNVPASLVETSQVVVNYETGRQYDIKHVQGWVRPQVDILQGDRVMDGKGQIYTVDAVSRSGVVFGAADKRLTLRLIEA